MNLNKKILASLSLLFISILSHAATVDPLPSWNNGDAKRSIIQFVQAVTDKSTPSYVAPERRIAALDNDGTLRVEKPVYTQIIFAIDRIKALAPKHPEWKNQRLFRAILNDDKQTLEHLSLEDIKKILLAAHTNMSIVDYHKLANEWFETAQDSRYHHSYKETIYQPMLEVINYLHDNDFQVYIVTGGGQEFLRTYATGSYNIDLDHVIGTVSEAKYEYINDKPALIKLSRLLFLNNGVVKPEAINYFIGRKPIIAFGNSVGDKQMLEWTQSEDGPHLMLLIHHDDETREYAYGPESNVGTFSDALKKQALQNHWKIVSMKNDWKIIFPFDLK
ncbi:HAD family hydrolase [Legionella brunensis]|uniref:Haloacid dehalogenase-like hydrolase n=1 Tax=Legionella brunensis TaxID=29422 RepID=A0A0W0SVV5_9GAMM|nr:HAD family hydrolase [Legionella brunensis]KTC87045.1 haloacid dehalogenase-like hydrolase [Legionella brunensis]